MIDLELREKFYIYCYLDQINELPANDPGRRFVPDLTDPDIWQKVLARSKKIGLTNKKFMELIGRK